MISVPNHSLLRRRIPIPLRFRLINNPPHLRPLLRTQFHLSARPILLQPLHLGRPRNRQHTLCRDPSQRHLTRCTPLLHRQLLDLFYNCFVLVEILALELGDRTPEVVGCEVFGRGVVEVVDEPAVAEGRVGNVGYVQLSSGGN
jgi:hypothetical protein